MHVQGLGQPLDGLLQPVTQQGQVSKAGEDLILAGLFVVYLPQSGFGFGEASRGEQSSRMPHLVG